MSGPEGKAQREAKHMSLIKAKARVNVARKNLRQLYDDVTGVDVAPPSDKKTDVEPKYTLVSVLDNTGIEIAEMAESIISVVNDLRKEIL